MTTPRNHRGVRGFTLLEITITLAILGIVMSIVYGVFSQTLMAKAHTEAVSDEFTSARSALGRITRDLQNARPAGGGQTASRRTPGLRPTGVPTPVATPSGSKLLPSAALFIGRTRTKHGLSIDDLAFTATIRRPTAITYGATDSGIVHYFLAPISDRSETLGLFRETIFTLTGEVFDPDTPDPAYTTLVLPGVIALGFRYFDGKDWTPEWDSTNGRRFGPAPFGVHVAITVANERGETESYQTAIDLPIESANRTQQPTPEPE